MRNSSVLMLVGLMLWSMGAGRAAAPQDYRDRVRAIIRLPVVSIEAGVHFSSEGGLHITPDVVELKKQAEVLEKREQQGVREADRWYTLSRLYQRMGEIGRAAQAREKALDLYQANGSDQAGEAGPKLRYAELLGRSGEGGRARQILERSAQEAGADAWRYWKGLGEQFQREAAGALLGLEAVEEVPESPAVYLQAGRSAGHSAASSEKVRQALVAAEESFERGRETGEEKAEYWIGYGLHRSLRAFFKALMDAEGKDVPDAVLLGNLFNAEAVAGMERAWDLDGRDAELGAVTALFMALGEVDDPMGMLELGSGFWGRLPAAVRSKVLNQMAELERLAADTPGEAGADAYEALAVAELIIIGEEAGALRHLRQAVRLDPNGARAWHMLVGVTARSGRYSELAELCQERVRQEDSAENRVLLAKALEKLDRTAAMEREVVQAIQLDPQSPLANLAVVALLLRKGDENSLAAARQVLARLDQMEIKDRNLVMESAVNLAAYYALNNEPGRARALLEQVMRIRPEHEYASRLLEVVPN